MPKLRSIDDVGPRYLDPIDRIRVRIGLQMADFIERRKTGDDFPEDSILAILGWDRLETDIELAAVRQTIRVDLVRKPAHCDRAAQMFLTNFGWKGVTRTTGPDDGAIFPFAQRVTPLNKIARKYPVKRCAFVKAVLNQLFEIRNRLRRSAVVKPYRKTPLLPVFAFTPLKVEYGHRVCQTNNRRREQDG